MNEDKAVQTEDIVYAVKRQPKSYYLNGDGERDKWVDSLSESNTFATMDEALDRIRIYMQRVPVEKWS